MKSSNTLTPICNGDAGKVDQVLQVDSDRQGRHDVAEAMGQASPAARSRSR